MPTTRFLTGFEHRISLISGAQNGGGVYSAAPTGTSGSIDTTTFKNGAAALKVALANGASAQSSNIFAAIALTTIFADGFWFRFDGNPNNQVRLREFSLGNSVFLTIFLNTDGSLQLVWTGGTSAVSSSSIACSPNTWYWVATNFKGDTTAFQARFRVTPDGGSTTTAGTDATVTSAGTCTLATAGRIGVINAVTLNAARNVYFDDLVFGLATGLDDFYIPQKVIKLVPGSDGTHVNPGNFSNADTGGSAISGGNAAAQYLDDVSFTTNARASTTDNVRQTADTTRASYLELINGTTPETGDATAVRALLSFSAPAATAQSGATIVRHSGGFAVAVFGDLQTAQGGGNAAVADYSEITEFFKGAIVPSPGTWTPTEVNAIRWRIGGSADVTPNPIWQALMLEVAYPIAVNATVTAVAADATGDVAVPTVAAATDATVTAVVADATGDLAAPALSAGANVTAVVADATGDLAAPAVSAGATVAAVAADASGDLAAPTLSGGATVTAVPADATGDVAANLPVSVEVVVVPAAATGDTPAPVAASILNATVTAVAADATGDMAAPSLSGGATVTAVAGDATGDAANPTLTAGAVVVAVVADATGDLAAPTLTAGSVVTAVAADATGDTPAPVVSGQANANVLAVTADASGDAASPTVTATVNLTVVPAVATGDAASPFVAGSGSANVQAVAADATADVATTNLPISVEVVVAPAAATGDLAAPTLSGGGSVTAVAADATGDLAPPAVTAGGGATVGAVPAAAAADSPFPALSALATVAATAAASFADLIAPTLSGGANLLPPAADATGSAGTPSIISGLVPKRAVRPPTHIGASTEANTTRTSWRRPDIQATLGPPPA